MSKKVEFLTLQTNIQLSMMTEYPSLDSSIGSALAGGLADRGGPGFESLQGRDYYSNYNQI